MRPKFRHLFNPLPQRRGARAWDPLFADPALVEDDYWRMRHARQPLS